MNTKTTIALVAIIAVLIGFGGGYATRGSMRTIQPGRGQGFGQGSRFGTNGQGRPVVGTIDTMAADHMTVKSADGSTHAILIDSNTQYHKTVSAIQSDFAQGVSILVIGKQNPDGSITAAS